MAEHTQAPFPTPPPFYKNFTKDNIKRLRQARKEQVSQDGGIDTQFTRANDEEKLDLLSLPSELRYLIPPPPPADGKWRAFGISHDLHAPEENLADAGIEVLYPDTLSVKLNPQPYLISLARSLLTTFLSLTGVLSEDPSLYEEKVADLRVLLLNMHDLINQYRPHQARESLIMMMEERVEKLKGETASIEEARRKVEGLLGGLREAGENQAKRDELQEAHGRANRAPVQELGKQRHRAAWAALDELDADG